ncbi:MAG: hypothetical protein WBO34_09790 [Gammaproteobacteria bacterium]
MKILALGDCNTVGINECHFNSFPERFASLVGAEVLNCGYTMATTREGVSMFNDNYDKSFDMVIISFGLTDSWQGIRYIPYIPYYPDNPLRKIGRKIVKKIRKTSRKLNLNRYMPVEHITTREQYVANIRYLIRRSSPALVFLPDTLPIDSEGRNDDIILYNRLLDNLVSDRDNVIRVHFYNHFAGHRAELFQDRTHLNERGCDLVASYIYQAYMSNTALPPA